MKKIILSCLAILATTTMFAQRTVDLSVESLIAPASLIGQFGVGTAVAPTVEIKNNSTDTIMVGDTFLYQASLSTTGGALISAMPNGSLFFRLATRNLNPGDTQHFSFSTGNTFIPNQSIEVVLGVRVFVTNRPSLALDAGTNNILNTNIDWLHPDGYGVSVDAIEAADLNVYPNPASDVLNINVPFVDAKSNVKVTITDMTGKEVKSASFTTSEDLSMNTESLENGIYIMTVNSGTKVYSSKVTIAK